MTVIGTAPDMGRHKTENTTQIAVRLPEDWLARLDALIPWLARPGVATTRTDAIRAAIAEGLVSLEAKRAEETKPRGKR